jgi:hypothetical protein
MIIYHPKTGCPVHATQNQAIAGDTQGFAPVAEIPVDTPLFYQRWLSSAYSRPGGDSPPLLVVFIRQPVPKLPILSNEYDRVVLSLNGT